MLSRILSPRALAKSANRINDVNNVNSLIGFARLPEIFGGSPSHQDG
jgi:hypothetical protein